MGLTGLLVLVGSGLAICAGAAYLLDVMGKVCFQEGDAGKAVQEAG